MRFVPGKDKDAFLVYASTLDVLEELPEERQGEAALMLLDFAFRDDMTVPFECSDNDWIMLHHVFEGIVREKKRYQMGQRLEKVIRTIEQLLQPTELENTVGEDAVRKLKELRNFARENPDKVGETDIYKILGPKRYSIVSHPDLLYLDLLTEFRNSIAKAPAERHEALMRELDDLVGFCKQLYPVPPDGAKQSNSTPTQVTKAAPVLVHEASSSQSPEVECPYPPQHKYYRRWMAEHDAKQRQSQSGDKSKPEPKPETETRKLPPPNDFPEEVLAKAAPPSLFDVDGFGDYEISPLNLSKGGKN